MLKCMWLFWPFWRNKLSIDFFLTTRVHWMNMFQYVQAWPSVGLGSGRGKLSCSLTYKELKLFQAFLNPEIQSPVVMANVEDGSVTRKIKIQKKDWRGKYTGKCAWRNTILCLSLNTSILKGLLQELSSLSCPKGIFCKGNRPRVFIRAWPIFRSGMVSVLGWFWRQGPREGQGFGGKDAFSFGWIL